MTFFPQIQTGNISFSNNIVLAKGEYSSKEVSKISTNEKFFLYQELHKTHCILFDRDSNVVIIQELLLLTFYTMKTVLCEFQSANISTHLTSKMLKRNEM